MRTLRQFWESIGCKIIGHRLIVVGATQKKYEEVVECKDCAFKYKRYKSLLTQ